LCKNTELKSDGTLKDVIPDEKGTGGKTIAIATDELVPA
jgi:hypothetical protein